MNERFGQEERIRLREMLSEVGEIKLVTELGVSTESLLRVLADLPIRRATAVVIRTAMQRYEKKRAR